MVYRGGAIGGVGLLPPSEGYFITVAATAAQRERTSHIHSCSWYIWRLCHYSGPLMNMTNLKVADRINLPHVTCGALRCIRCGNYGYKYASVEMN